MSDHIVIVGAGQGGVQLADSLRLEGWTGAITLIADELHLPYQRPPLSKDFMAEESPGEALPLRGGQFFVESGVDFRPGVTVVSIDRDAKTVTTDSGDPLHYSSLVFATGARNRQLEIAGSELAGVHYLRTLDDATGLQAELAAAKRVVVVGAGFIGLEFAASARKRGLEVTVLEFGPRVMGRVLSVPMSNHFAAIHTAAGIDVRLGQGIASLVGADGKVSAAIGTDGTVFPADLVVVGIGVVPNDQIAGDSGISTANGIVVDALLRSSDESVFALGDCCSFPNTWDGAAIRIESVQNATDQARALAKTLTGTPSPYRNSPWFWSLQGGARLQIAGITRSDDDAVLRGNPGDGRFSIYCFRGAELAGVESVNSPADHLGARRMLDSRIAVTREQVADLSFDLKAHSKGEVAALA